MNISIRVNDKEERLFKAYAKSNHMTLSEMLRKYTLERIEDEIDIKACEDYLLREELGETEFTPASEVFEKLGV